MKKATEQEKRFMKEFNSNPKVDRETFLIVLRGKRDTALNDSYNAFCKGWEPAL